MGKYRALFKVVATLLILAIVVGPFNMSVAALTTSPAPTSTVTSGSSEDTESVINYIKVRLAFISRILNITPIIPKNITDRLIEMASLTDEELASMSYDELLSLKEELDTLFIQTLTYVSTPKNITEINLLAKLNYLMNVLEAKAKALNLSNAEELINEAYMKLSSGNITGALELINMSKKLIIHIEINVTLEITIDVLINISVSKVGKIYNITKLMNVINESLNEVIKSETFINKLAKTVPKELKSKVNETLKELMALKDYLDTLHEYLSNLSKQLPTPIMPPHILNKVLNESLLTKYEDIHEELSDLLRSLECVKSALKLKNITSPEMSKLLSDVEEAIDELKELKEGLEYCINSSDIKCFIKYLRLIIDRINRTRVIIMELWVGSGVDELIAELNETLNTYNETYSELLNELKNLTYNATLINDTELLSELEGLIEELIAYIKNVSKTFNECIDVCDLIIANKTLSDLSSKIEIVKNMTKHYKELLINRTKEKFEKLMETIEELVDNLTSINNTFYGLKPHEFINITPEIKELINMFNKLLKEVNQTLSNATELLKSGYIALAEHEIHRAKKLISELGKVIFDIESLIHEVKTNPKFRLNYLRNRLESLKQEFWNLIMNYTGKVTKRMEQLISEIQDRFELAETALNNAEALLNMGFVEDAKQYLDDAENFINEAELKLQELKAEMGYT